MTHRAGRLCNHACRECWREHETRRPVPTRTPRPDKPKPRARFKPGERVGQLRRGAVYADEVEIVYVDV